MSNITQNDVCIMGLTGGIATGKSFVADVLKRCGAHVIDADEAAREVVRPGTPGLHQVVRQFGSEILQNDGALNRAALGRIVFSDDKARAMLEEILHPFIYDHMQRDLQRVMEQHVAPVVVLDIPLLFETNMLREYMDGIIVVYVPEHIQKHRLMERNNLNEKEAEQRIASQMPLQRKVNMATHVIDNSGTKEATRQQVIALWKELTDDENSAHRA